PRQRRVEHAEGDGVRREGRRNGAAAAARGEDPVAGAPAIEAADEAQPSTRELALQPAPLAVERLVAADDDQIDANAAQLVDEVVADLLGVPHRAESEELRRRESRRAVGHGAVV